MKKFMVLILAITLLASVASAQVWGARESKDMMTGATSHSVIGLSETSHGTLKNAAIGIRFMNNEIEILIIWGGYSMDEKKGCVVRFGEAVASAWPLDGISADDETLFLGRVSDFLAKLKSMGPEESIVIQSTRNTGVKSTARWYIGNLHEVAKGVLPGW